MSTEKLAALLSGLSGISILLAAYFTQIDVGYGGSPTYLRRWAKWFFYPVMILAQTAALSLLLFG